MFNWRLSRSLAMFVTVAFVSIVIVSPMSDVAKAQEILTTPDQCSCCEGTELTQDVVALEGSDLGKARADALSAEDVRLLKQHLEAKGFQPKFDKAFGAQTDSKQVIILPFTSNSGDYSAAIAYGKNSDGTTMVETGIFAQDSEGNVVVVEKYTVENGQVVTANSYWDCMWKCALAICGPGCVGCGFAGPSWWLCCVAVCGAGVLVCLIICA